MSFSCGKCDGGNFIKHSLRCEKRDSEERQLFKEYLGVKEPDKAPEEGTDNDRI